MGKTLPGSLSFKTCHLIILVVIFLACSAETPAQKADPEFKWKDKGKYEEVPDTFKHGDVLIVRKDIYMTFDENSTNNLPYWQMNLPHTEYSHLFSYLKLKILTKDGLNSCSHYLLPGFDFQRMDITDARILKRNGKVTDIDANSISMDSSARPFTNVRKELLIPMKDADVGDELEIITLQSEDWIHHSEEFLLNDPSWFSLSSSFTINMPLDYEPEIKCYNGLPLPGIDTVNGKKRYQWLGEWLTPFGYESHSIPQLEYPFVRFAIRYIHLKPEDQFLHSFYDIPDPVQLAESSWFDYSDMFADINSLAPPFIRNRITKHFNSQFENYLSYSLVPDTLERIVRFYNYVRNNIHVINVSSEKFDNAIDYYLKRNEVTQPIMLYFFDRMFRELNMNYFIGLARNKFEGPMDLAFVSKYQATDLYLGFEFQKHFYYFFFPTTTTNYEFGEIPPELRGTESLLISKNSNPDPVQKFKLPASPEEQNFFKTSVFLDIQTAGGLVKRKDKLAFSGCVSTENRSDYSGGKGDEDRLIREAAKEERKDSSGYMLDSARVVMLDHKSPFLFTLEKNLHKDNAAQSTVDQGLTVSLAGLIHPHVLPYSTLARTTSFVPTYPYQDQVKIYLMFDKAVDLKNASELTTDWSGIPGSYHLSISQINETTLLVESAYTVKSSEIKPGDYSQIGQLNEQAMRAGKKEVRVQVKMSK